MKKMFSLLKATMSQDMDLFKFKTKSHKQTNKLLFPIFMALVLMFSVGNLANLFMQELPTQFQFIVLTLFVTGVSVLTAWEGIYKSQGILFSTKDNDLLFSLPINKRQIFFSRIVKLLTFQFLFNFLFIVPAFVVYAYYIHPSASYYITSIIMLIVLPMLPTTIGSILGYIVKQISSKFKAKRFIEILLTSLIIVGVFYLSFAMEGIVAKLGENALNVQKIIETVYYPIKLYMNLINDFNILDLLIFIAINIIPLLLFIYIASLSYFKISSKNMETYASSSRKSKSLKIKFKSKLRALITKELKRFFSSTVYIVNAGFSIVLILVITIVASVNFEGTINTIVSGYETNIDINAVINILPKLFFCLVVLMSFMTSITSSMISIEGKSFNITKSLPIKPSKILFAKVLASNVITIPAIIISDLIFFFRFNVEIVDILFIVAASIICPTLSAIFGLIINLKYPNMNAKSDTEIVKQSMSSMISVFLGMGIGGLAVFGTLYYGYKMNINLFVLLELIVFTVVLVLMGSILKKYGTKKFKEINV